MNNFLKIYLDIINEWTYFGNQSMSKFQKSFEKGLRYFKINQGHTNNKDYERMLTYDHSEDKCFKILDEACFQILSNNVDKILNTEKIPVKFDCLVKLENDYYNFVIGFNSLKSAFLYTVVDISMKKYLKLSMMKSRIDSNGDINYIIVLHDF